MKVKETTYGILFLMLVIIVSLVFFLFNSPMKSSEVISSQGMEDLTNVDFKDNVYQLTPQWDSWKEKLYSPEELAIAGEPLSSNQLDYSKVNYVTHRLYLKFTPNIRYGLSYNTSNFAMRMYIDGEEVSIGGIPSNTKEKTKPSIEKEVSYFTPEKDITEIVVQVANFVHVEGGKPPVFIIGLESEIIEYEKFFNMKQGFLFGLLSVTSLSYLCVFLLNQSQKSALLFSILCMFLSFASGNVFELYMDDWVLAMRLEYLNYIWAAIAYVLLGNTLFPNKTYKYISYIYMICCITFSFIILLTRPLFFSSLLIIFQAISITMILLSLFILLFGTKNWSFKKIFAFLGIFLFSSIIIIDILSRNGVYGFQFLAGKTFNSAVGMVLFVFCYTMVLSVEQREVNIRVERLHQALGAAEKKYYKLVSKRENGVSHDILSQYRLSKREKEILLLLVDGNSREKIMQLLYISLGTVNTHCSHIYQKTGCNSVVSLINKFKNG